MTRTFLKEVNAPERTASLWVGLVWLGFLGGRLTAGLVVRPGYEAWLGLVLILFVGGCLGNLIGTYRAAAGGLARPVLGVAPAPVRPAVLGRGLGGLPADAWG